MTNHEKLLDMMENSNVRNLLNYRWCCEGLLGTTGISQGYMIAVYAVED